MTALLPILLLLVQAVISVHTELVAVPVVVTDGYGQRVSDLRPESFQVYDEGRPQPIVVFDHGDAPVTLGLVVDRSQSMRMKMPALVVAVSALLHASRSDDELFAVDVNDRVSLALADAVPFTHDADALETALVAVPTEGRTALYDGLAVGLRHLQLGHAEKRVLIVVSDGGDNASQRTYNDVLALARQSNAVIYAIGLLGTSPVQEDEDAGLLKRLCRDTGGLAYFPRTLEEVAATATELARELREQYTLGFTPTDRRGGPVFRRIEVRVAATGHGRLHVRTRAGYLAGDGTP